MNLTSYEKSKLAGLAGLKQWRSEQGTYANFYVNSKGREVCQLQDFDPVNNGSHTMLVLEGMVEKLARENKQTKVRVITQLLRGWIEQFSDSDEIDLGSAVCEAGLEVLKQKGGVK